MHHHSLALIAGMLLAPSVALGQSDLEALIPQDAFFVARASSLGQLEDVSVALAEAFAAVETAPSLTDGFLGHLTSLRKDLPAAFAVSLRGGEMITTLILPTSDAAGMRAQVDAAPDSATPIIRGAYVGFCDGSEYKGGGAAFMRGFPAGTLAMRLDVAKLIEVYGPMIEMGLDQARMMIDEGLGAVPDTGMEMEAIMDLYFDAIDNFLLSAQILDVSTNLTDGEWTLEGALQVGPKSPMGRLASDTRCDLTSMARSIQGEGNVVSFVTGFNYGEVMEGYMELMDEIMSIYPEEMRAPLTGIMKAYSESLKDAGPSMGGAFNMDGGMNFTYVMEATQPESVVADMRSIYSNKDWQNEMFNFDAPSDLTIDGVAGFQSRMHMDVQALVTEGLNDQNLKPFMDAIYGPDGLPVWIGSTEKHLVITGGSNLNNRQQTLQRIKQPSASLSPGMDWALKAMGTSTPSMAMEMDIVAALRQLAPTLGSMGSAIPTLPEDLPSSATFTEYFVIDGPVWRGGLRLPLKPWAEFIRAYGN